jgi:hypothetical protein
MAGRDTMGCVNRAIIRVPIRPSLPAAPELTFLLTEYVSREENNLILFSTAGPEEWPLTGAEKAGGA